MYGMEITLLEKSIQNKSLADNCANVYPKKVMQDQSFPENPTPMTYRYGHIE